MHVKPRVAVVSHLSHRHSRSKCFPTKANAYRAQEDPLSKPRHFVCASCVLPKGLSIRFSLDVEAELILFGLVGKKKNHKHKHFAPPGPRRC